MGSCLIDIGNTTLKWCKGVSVDLIHHVPVESLYQKKNRADLITRLLTEGVGQVYLCSVAREELTQLLLTELKNEEVSISRFHSQKKYEGSFTLLNLYQNPLTLGSDRWYSAIGAVKTLPQRSLVVVNFGTATVIDSIIHNTGDCYEFFGGRILPGVEMMKKAFMEKLGHITNSLNEQFEIEGDIDFPINTTQAIATGLIEAQIGSISLVVNKMRKMGHEPSLIISGGWAPKFDSILKKQFVETYLVLNTVLTGIAAVLSRGAGPSCPRKNSD